MTRNAILDQLKRAQPGFYNLVVARAVHCDADQGGLTLHFASPKDLARFWEFAPGAMKASKLRLHGRRVQ